MQELVNPKFSAPVGWNRKGFKRERGTVWFVVQKRCQAKVKAVRISVLQRKHVRRGTPRYTDTHDAQRSNQAFSDPFYLCGRVWTDTWILLACR